MDAHIQDLVPTDTFHQFAQLPKEIRLQIWNCALQSRVIPINQVRRSPYTRRMGLNWLALTTNYPSFDALNQACPESQFVCRRRFIEFEIWDVYKSRLGTPYDASHDVLSFCSPVDASTLLDFVNQYPTETFRLRTLALPGILSPEQIPHRDLLACLHEFDNLVNVIVVIGSARTTPASGSWQQDNQGNIREYPSELSYRVGETLRQMKNNIWPDWKIPVVTVVRSHEDILCDQRKAHAD